MDSKSLSLNHVKNHNSYVGKNMVRPISPNSKVKINKVKSANLPVQGTTPVGKKRPILQNKKTVTEQMFEN